MFHQPLKLLFAGLTIMSGVFANPASSCSQWKIVATTPSSEVQTIYFLEDSTPSVGFASAHYNLFRTSDGGITWRDLGKDFGLISDFEFIDRTNGFAGVWRHGRGVGIFRTSDQGLVWEVAPGTTLTADPAYRLGSVVSIGYCAESRSLFVGSWNPSFSFLKTSDFGDSFVRNVNDQPNIGWGGLSFYKNFGILTHQPNGGGVPTDFTTDGGLTWSPSGLPEEAWSSLALKSKPVFYVAPEFRGVYRKDSTEPTWVPLGPYAIPHRPMGDIQGDECGLYFQSDGGLYRTWDGGVTWSFIGGPAHSFDNRFYASNGYVYAGDTLGNVWFLRDTAIGPHEARLVIFEKASLEFGEVGGCREIEKTLHFSNRYICLPVEVLSWRWQTPTNSFEVQGSRQSFTVAAEGRDSLTIRYLAAGSGDSTRNLVLRLRVGNTIVDTSIAIHGRRIVAPRASLSSPSLVFDTTAPCESQAMTTMLYNYTCDTLQVVLTRPGNGFSLLSPIQSTLSLYPGDSLPIVVSFRETLAGQYFDQVGLQVVSSEGEKYGWSITCGGTVAGSERGVELQYSVDPLRACDSAMWRGVLRNQSCGPISIESLEGGREESVRYPSFPVLLAPGDSLNVGGSLTATLKGIQTFLLSARLARAKGSDTVRSDTTLTINVNVEPGIAELDTDLDTVNFGLVPTCDSSTLAFHVINTGCDSLYVSGTSLLVGALQASETVPGWIGAGDTVPVHVTFRPESFQPIEDGITVFTSAGEKRVVLRGIGVPESSKAAVLQSSVDFRSVVAGCGADTSRVGVRNDGCKSIEITAADIAPPFRVPAGVVPVTIAPGEGMMLPVIYEPVVAGLSNATLTLSHRGEDGVTKTNTIALAGTAKGQPSLAFDIGIPKLSGMVEEEIPIELFVSANEDVSLSSPLVAEFDLAMNTDLLHPVEFSPAAGVTMTQTVEKERIRLSLTIAGGLTAARRQIATVVTSVRVTDTMETPISLTSLTFDAARYCANAVLAAHPVSVRLLPECADPTLTDFLAKKPLLRILSIQPNPAKSTVIVSYFQESRPGEAPMLRPTYAIHDMNGQQVASGVIGADGAVNCSELASGVYFLELKGQDAAATRSFVIER